MAEGGAPRPLQLVRPLHGFTRFEAVAEALAALRLLPGPLYPVAAMGDMRSGKSYLLNVLAWQLGAPPGQHFEIDPGMETHTRGVWCLALPREGGGHWLLLDFEGLASPMRPDDYDARLFALASLLSSTLVFNSMGSIVSRDLVSRFQALTLLTDVLGGGDDAGRDFAQFFPSLLWVLRDFYLRPGGHAPEAVAERQLRDLLAPEDVQNPHHPAAQANAIRQRIRAWFPNVQVRTLPRPVDDEADLQGLEAFGFEELRREFQEGCQDLMANVVASTEFALNGRRVSGAMYAEYCHELVARVSCGMVQRADLLTLMVRRSCDVALAEADRVWHQHADPIAEHVPAREQEMEQVLEEAFAAATATMVRQMMAQEAGAVEQQRQQLRERLAPAMAALRGRNRESCNQAIGRLLDEEAAQLRQRRQAGEFDYPHGSHEDFDRRSADALLRVRGASEGWPADIVEGTCRAAQHDFAHQSTLLRRYNAQLVQHEREREARTQEVRELRERIEQAAVEAGRRLADFEAMSVEQQEQLRLEWERQAVDLRAQLTENERRLEEENRRVQERLEQLAAEFRAQNEAQAAQLREQQERAEQRFREHQRQHAREMAEMRRRIAAAIAAAKDDNGGCCAIL